MALRFKVPKLGDYQCFACGTANPIGLRMEFYREDDSVMSEIEFNEHHSGWERVVHGGLITTVLDEIMGWTIMVFQRRFFVTRNLEVRFLRPVETGVPLVVRGKLEPGGDDGGCKASGVLMVKGGKRLATATADLRFIPEARLKMLPEKYQVEVNRVFREIEELMAAPSDLSVPNPA